MMAQTKAIVVCLVICTLVTLLFARLVTSASSPSRHCLDCMCHASSGCKLNIRCHNTGNGQYYCGPYQISWAYWADAGKPGYNGFSNDFENCLVDKNCAEATVRGYMAKWGTDCNGDGQVDCLDYAAIHKAGPTGCNQQWLLNSKYWTQINQCYKQSASSSVISSTSTFTAVSSPANSIIEIPSSTLVHGSSSSNINRPALSASVISAPSSPTIHSSSSVGSGPIVHTSYSSSYTNEDYSHSETEITESDSSSSNGYSNTNRLPAFSNTVYKAMSIPSGPLTSSGYKPTSSVSRLVVTPSSTGYSSNSPNGGSVLFASVATAPAAPAVSALAPAPAPAPTASSTANFEPIVSGECLQCLCQASSKCKLDKGCDGAYCGPYLLSWGYWSDGGRPGNGVDYPTCARNVSCAEQAVQGYMNKWNRDCNNDGEVDCIDFALIHKLGPHACGRLEALKQTQYWNQFESCYNPPTYSDIRTPTERSIVSSSNSNSNNLNSDRFIGPLKPQNYAISSSGPAINVERPAPVRPAISRNVPSANLVSSSGPYRPDSASVHISFNNRDVVNTNPRQTQPPLAEIPNNINSNIISNSPFRASFSNLPLATRRPLRAESYTVSSINYPRSNPVPVNNPNPIVPVSFNRNVPSNSRNLPGNDRFFTNPRPAEHANRPSSDVYNSELSSSPDNLDDPALYESNSPRESPSAGLTEVIPPSQAQPLPQNYNPAPAVNVSRPTSGSNSRVPQECLECICHASSRCSTQIGCLNGGSNKFICGPYQVDWEYWTEAGKPGNRADLSNLENFQMCLNNRECADQTVRGYMEKFHKDCNEDGVVDCNDYAALHVAGPRACNAQWYAESKYFSDFRECFDFRRR